VTNVTRFPLLVLVGLMLGSLGLGCAERPAKVQRFGQVIGIKKENIAEYKRMHAACWPGVLKNLKDCHFRNYSTWLVEIKPDEYCLFSYYEYTGDDLDKDLAKMKADPVRQEWLKLSDPLKYKLPTAKDGEMWYKGEQVFYMP